MAFLCLDIINSDHVDWRSSKIQRDMLNDKEWLRHILIKWGLVAPLPISSHFQKELVTLRKHMRAIIVDLNRGLAIHQDQLNEINKTLTNVSSYIQLISNNGGFEFEQIYDNEGWPLVIRHITYSFAELLYKHDVAKIKICDNQDCGWAFFDQSRNRSRRWCDDKICGNVMKVRRYRSRQKNKGKND